MDFPIILSNWTIRPNVKKSRFRCASLLAITTQAWNFRLFTTEIKRFHKFYFKKILSRIYIMCWMYRGNILQRASFSPIDQSRSVLALLVLLRDNFSYIQPWTLSKTSIKWFSTNFIRKIFKNILFRNQAWKLISFTRLFNWGVPMTCKHFYAPFIPRFACPSTPNFYLPADFCVKELEMAVFLLWKNMVSRWEAFISCFLMKMKIIFSSSPKICRLWPQMTYLDRKWPISTYLVNFDLKWPILTWNEPL